MTTTAIATAIPMIPPVDKLMEPVSAPSAPGSPEFTSDPTPPAVTPVPSWPLELEVGNEPAVVVDACAVVVDWAASTTEGKERARRRRGLTRLVSILTGSCSRSSTEK